MRLGCPFPIMDGIRGMQQEKMCSLELELAEESENAASVTAYVKRVLEEYFSLNIKIADRQEFHSQMLAAIREEMQSQGMKLVGALLAGIGAAGTPSIRPGTVSDETGLPNVCDALPDEL